jgi:hypothetical protein
MTVEQAKTGLRDAGEQLQVDLDAWVRRHTLELALGAFLAGFQWGLSATGSTRLASSVFDRAVAMLASCLQPQRGD